MNGSIFFKEEKKRRGIFIEVLKNVDVNEVERLFKVEYRRKREFEQKGKIKNKDNKKMKNRQSFRENRIIRDMIRYFDF